MKRNEVIEVVKNVCAKRIEKRVVVFDDSYLVKEGRNRRLKFSGCYGGNKELEELKEKLVDEIMICNEGKWNESRWKIIRIYNRITSDNMNYFWRDDSDCVCVLLKKI